MEKYILDKNHLSYLLRQLRNGSRLIAPLRNESGDIVFGDVEKIHEIELDCPALLPTIKEFFFPQTEIILEKNNGRLHDIPEAPSTVIFGTRSCDVTAFNIADRFFGGQFRDPYYSAKRENTLIISIGCNRPDPTCFCSSLGVGPFLTKSFDIQLTDLGDRYYVEIDSPRARKIMKRFTHLFARPVKTDLEDQYEAIHHSGTFFEKKLNFDAMRNAIASGQIDDRFWKSVADRCFECGGCVYQCPLCTCFNVMDRTRNDRIERIRTWDTCMFKGFTRLTPGILPNEAMINRTKRWYYHKIIYNPEQIDAYGCVGCGRCTVSCPAVIDMATVGLKIGKGAEVY